jgi:hydrogenase maturation protease
MKPLQTRCLILACGNTLREDDGIGPWLAARAEERFAANPSVQIISRQQWTPELAEDIAHAESVLFVDCAMNAQPGAVLLAPIAPEADSRAPATHQSSAAELLALSRSLYSTIPHTSLLLTVGAASLELRESFSAEVAAVLPEAFALLEMTVLQLLTACATSPVSQRT